MSAAQKQPSTRLSMRCCTSIVAVPCDSAGSGTNSTATMETMACDRLGNV